MISPLRPSRWGWRSAYDAPLALRGLLTHMLVKERDWRLASASFVAAELERLKASLRNTCRTKHAAG